MKLNFRSTEQQEKEKDPKKVLDNMRKSTSLSLIATMILVAVMPAFGLENPSQLQPIKPMDSMQPRTPEISGHFVNEDGEPINTENEDRFGILAKIKEMLRGLPEVGDIRLEKIFNNFNKERELMGYGPCKTGYIPAGPNIPVRK